MLGLWGVQQPYMHVDYAITFPVSHNIDDPYHSIQPCAYGTRLGSRFFRHVRTYVNLYHNKQSKSILDILFSYVFHFEPPGNITLCTKYTPNVSAGIFYFLFHLLFDDGELGRLCLVFVDYFRPLISRTITRGHLRTCSIRNEGRCEGFSSVTFQPACLQFR